MKYNSSIHHRRSIRLKGYDYSQAGLYFVTICVENRECLLGEILDDEMILNDAGKMVETEWLNLRNRYPNVELHEFITMPNHFHGILEITATVGASLVDAPNNREKRATTRVAPTVPTTPTTITTGTTIHDKTIGDMMDAFKSITTVKYIHGVKNMRWQPFNGKIWQRNYYEHIIRNEQSYMNISDYIINHPAKWQDDKCYQA
ncbi:Transposase [Bacteroidales bacterium Barb7]|nr:Transposase [Bacteroidales bacterium Barb7]